ncbi:hypothetical protein E2542_SST13823 [Spatholobus suberectus]|nr:hypothetical protein E2542_SST13823 [Spatholobus suberectus]
MFTSIHGAIFLLINMYWPENPDILDTMDDMAYMGPKPGNVDVLVHFMEMKGDPIVIQNVDPDRFDMFDATDSVNMIAEDLGLPPCHRFILWYWSGGSRNILPLANAKDMLLMFFENKNCAYIHMYVTKSRAEFWKEIVSACFTEVAHVVNEFVKECVDQPVNVPMKEI